MPKIHRLEGLLMGLASTTLAVLLTCSEGGAAPTLAGNTGLIKTPTAAVIPEGDLVLGFSWVGGPRSYLFRPSINRMYFASLGVLPGLEVSLNMLQVLGWVDPEAPGVAYAIHRMSHAKYRLPLPGVGPQVAVGVQDPFSVNGLTRGANGQTDYGLATYYGVLSQPLGPVGLHLGYAIGRDFIKGFFGGLDADLGHGLNARVEFDGQQWNAGLTWQPLSQVTLYTAGLFPDAYAYGMAVRGSL